MSGRLDGKRALVTGGASGIGLAVAERYLAEGARVTLVDRNPEAAELAAEGIDPAHAAALRVEVADVADEASLAAAFEAATNAWGGLDVVVANASVYSREREGDVCSLDIEFFRRVLEVNVLGVFLTCRMAIGALRETGGGSVICTGSPTGLSGGLGAQLAAYGTSKAAVHNLARILAFDHGVDNIRVNVVVPGFTRTPMTESIFADSHAVADLVQRIPLGRPGQPDDVAGAYVFLASDEAAFVSGALVTVDGGLSTS